MVHLGMGPRIRARKKRGGLILGSFSQCGADQIPEQGMRPRRAGKKFGMELTGDEPRMVFQLDDFDQLGLRIDSGKNHALVFQNLFEFVVEFVAVAMTLRNVFGTVSPASQCVFFDVAVVQSQPHRSAFLHSGILIGHEIDDVIKIGRAHV